MFYYQEITIIDQAEISPHFVWSKLYNQVHLALVEAQNHDEIVYIGVSFPQYIYQKDDAGKNIINIGTKLRLFANVEEELQNLNIKDWLVRLTDYIHIGSIRPVPQNRVTSYVRFYRKQFKTNAERLARHRVKTRNDISFDNAVKLYQNRVKMTNLPFIQLKSSTNNQQFKLFIEKNIGEKSNEYKFNTYGLSFESSVPEF